MTLQPWLYTLFVVVGGFHVLAVLYAYWFKRVSDDGVEPADSTEKSFQLNEVDCPECGTTNERGYRYCANCVSELPSGDNIDRKPTAPVEWQIF
ncbi:hypothetical protein SAMN04488067_11110 [Halorubrum xinjiangense]|uniref:DUF7577 domain-containing protein n=1 Tax=Halorubrum xinjiangense TaxID=261291 RepID=A0A1G7Q2N4_9EURY|nr:hypothetical protein [Halorubrum xinjiangense]SDF92847.1 hypothetical protein SAMN04488067_11110 [Halorubrum xinjiangense]